MKLSVLGSAFLLGACLTQAQTSRHFNLNIDGDADTCDGIKASSKDGEIARAAEKYTLQKGEASGLEVSAADRGMIRVRSWDRPEISVEACKIAVASDQSRAGQVLGGISVSRSGGRFSASGPQTDTAEWNVYFLVHAPKDARLDLQTKNGPIDVAGMSGGIKVRATNGPLSLKNCTGTIDAQTVNGPISFSGTGGDVQLVATNGPISMKLANDIWNGPKLEARTTNGPVNLSIPETFQSSLRVDTSNHSPVNCRIKACAQAWTDLGSDQRTFRLNGSSETVRVSTTNGPITLGTSRNAKI